MSMFGPKMGTWWLHSDEDTRWNASGRAPVGGFLMPLEAKDALRKLKTIYGEPPADLEHGYMKD
jgi:hypothetical protein